MAVEAAQVEIDSRQLTQDQLSDAKATQKLSRQDEAKKQKSIEDKFKYIAYSLADTFNLIQKENPTTEKLIKQIALFISLLFLYQLYTEFSTLKFMFTNGSGKGDSSMVLYLLPFFILPTAGLLFWLREKIGWIHATIYFSYTAAGAVPMFIMALNRKTTGVVVLDTFFTSPPIYI